MLILIKQKVNLLLEGKSLVPNDELDWRNKMIPRSIGGLS